jgi:predicted O-methyltransferase YrrM
MEFKEAQELTKGISALLAEEDKEILFTYAQKVPTGGIIVDIGTCAGGSAFMMGLGSDPSATVYTMDPNKHEPLMEDAEKLGLGGRIVYLKQTSEEVAKEWDGTPIDLLFIDGIHSYWGVKVDLEGLGKYVKKDGYIIAHDALLYGGIGEAMEEACKNGFIEKIELRSTLYRDDPRPIGVFISRKL